jgi:hypothetical protein
MLVTHSQLAGAHDNTLMRCSFEQVGIYLKKFSCTDLMAFLCGEEHIDAEMIIANINFVGSVTSSQRVRVSLIIFTIRYRWGDVASSSLSSSTRRLTTRDFLPIILRELDAPNLRHFLRLVTAKCAFPLGGFTPPLRMKRSRDFVAHTCFHELELPDYSSIQEFRAAFSAALAAADTSLED